jgi:hypothetical protein
VLISDPPAAWTVAAIVVFSYVAGLALAWRTKRRTDPDVRSAG